MLNISKLPNPGNHSPSKSAVLLSFSKRNHEHSVDSNKNDKSGTDRLEPPSDKSFARGKTSGMHTTDILSLPQIFGLKKKNSNVSKGSFKGKSSSNFAGESNEGFEKQLSYLSRSSKASKGGLGARKQ